MPPAAKTNALGFDVITAYAASEGHLWTPRRKVPVPDEKSPVEKSPVHRQMPSRKAAAKHPLRGGAAGRRVSIGW